MSERTGRICPILPIAVVLCGLAAAPSPAAIQAPVLKWQHGGCYASWCETGWYSSPAVADLDGDGTMEVVAGAYTLFILNGEDGSVQRSIDTPGSRFWAGVVLADVDHDSDLEIVTAQGDGYLNVLNHAGDAVFTRRPITSELRGLSVYDLDGDGTLELIVTAAVGNKLSTWVYEHDGTLRAGWPQLSGSSAYAAGVYNNNAAIYDVDGDGLAEILLPTDVHYICGYDANGTQMPANAVYGGKGWGLVGVWEDYDVELRGWGSCSASDPRSERYRPNFAHNPAAIADLDGDGTVEVVATGNVYDCIPGYPSKYTGIFVFNADRSRFVTGGYDWRTVPVDTGAPLSEDWLVIETAMPNPVPADLDGDGEKEILYASYDGRVHAFWLDGTEHHNWPVSVYGGSGPFRFASEPAIADLDNDGKAEVIFASWVQKGTNQTGKLHILDDQGNPLHEIDLPLAFSGDWNGALAAPTLANIDADPDLEVVLNTAHSGVVAYDLPGTSSARVIWGTGRGNYQRTGSPLRETTPPSNPSSLSSTSHTVDVPSIDATVDMAWSHDASDGGGSGVAGYSVAWTQTATTAPDTTVDLAADVYSTTSPALTEGEWYFHLRTCDQAGNCAVPMHAGPYVVATPILTAPADGAVLTTATPSFDWDDLAGAVQYRIQVDDAQDFSSPAIDATTAVSSYTPGAPLADGSYFWRVRAQDGGGLWSGDSQVWNVAIDTVPPSTPTLLSPVHHQAVSDNTPFFDWSDVTDAVRYELQIDDNGGFSSPLVDTTLPASSYTATVALADGTYFWRVRAQDDAGWWSPFSSSFELAVDTVPPPVPTLLLPANGSSTVDNTPDFDWNDAPDAVQYEIQIDDQATFASPAVDVVLGASQFVPTGALADGVYYWRVRARDDANLWSGFSPSWRFVVDTIPPLAPRLSSPADHASVRGTPNYVWLAAASAVRYQYAYDDNADFGSPVYVSGELATVSHKPPLQAPGSYYWHVRARDAAGNWSQWSTPRAVTILLPTPAAPKLLTPAPGSATNDTTPDFAWSAVDYGATYQIQIDGHSNFATPDQAQIVSSPGYTAAELAPGLYFWRVRARNSDDVPGAWSVIGRVVVDITPPAVPALRVPADGANILTPRPTLGVVAVAGANRYGFQVSTDAGFGSTVIDVTVGAAAFAPSAAQALSYGSNYFWRARALDAAGNLSGWSVARRFVVTVHRLPVDGSYTLNPKPTFTWIGVAGALHYQFQVDDDSGFGSPVIDRTQSVAGGYAPTAPLAFGIYYWRVRGETASGWSGWMPAWKLTVTGKPPVAPVLINPAAGALVSDSTPDFTWNAVTGGSTYQIQIDAQSSFLSPDQDQMVSTTAYTASDLAPGVYYWRVRARNDLDVAGAWSAARRFTRTSS